MLHLEIKGALQEALKDKDFDEVPSLRIILGELSRLKGNKHGKGVVLGDVIPDDLVVKILTSLQKEEMDRLSYTTDTHSVMLEVLDKFLPKTVSKDVIRKWLFDNDILNGLKHPNQSISLAKKEFGMNVASSDVKEVVEEILSKLNEGI